MDVVALEVYKDDQISNADPSLPSTSASNSRYVVVWKESCPSSPDAVQPILLVLGKEDKDLPNKIVLTCRRRNERVGDQWDQIS